MFGRVIKLFKSLKFTVVLLISLLVVFITGVVVPQKSILGDGLFNEWRAVKPGLVYFLEFTGLTEIYTSPITIALWAVFFVNLVTVMSGRIPLIWKRTMRVEYPKDPDKMKGKKHYCDIDNATIDDASRAARGHGYRVYGEGDSIFAVKNRLSPLGTILFHLSFFLVLLGVVMTFYTKYGNEVIVAVGETFEGKYPSARPPRIGSVPDITFKVLDIRPTYFKKNLPVDLDITLETRQGRKILGVNRPYNEGATSVVFMNLDVAPLFVLKDPGGEELDGAYVKLNVLSGKEDSFNMSGYVFRTFFYTDVDLAIAGEDVAPGAEQLPQSLKQSPQKTKRLQPMEIVSPAFKVTALRKGDEIATKLLRLGDKMEFDGGHTLKFEDLTYWVKLYIVKEHGLGLVYAGFALMCAALFVRFAFYRRELKAVAEGGKLHISGRAEFFPALFTDEFDAVIKSIRGARSRAASP